MREYELFRDTNMIDSVFIPFVFHRLIEHLLASGENKIWSIIHDELLRFHASFHNGLRKIVVSQNSIKWPLFPSVGFLYPQGTNT